LRKLTHAAYNGKAGPLASGKLLLGKLHHDRIGEFFAWPPPERVVRDAPPQLGIRNATTANPTPAPRSAPPRTADPANNGHASFFV
jgi:hypothetical protein